MLPLGAERDLVGKHNARHRSGLPNGRSLGQVLRRWLTCCLAEHSDEPTGIFVTQLQRYRLLHIAAERSRRRLRFRS